MLRRLVNDSCVGVLAVIAAGARCASILIAVGANSLAAPLPPDATYRPLPTQSFGDTKRDDEAAKPEAMRRQQDTLQRRYDLSDRPISGVVMSGGPYLHDGRLPTLADTVEFFNLVLGLRLNETEKNSLVAYLLAL